MNQLEPFAQVRNERPCSVSAEMRARQLSKIRDLAETVEAAGFLTLDEQAKILGLPRSTAWFGAPPSTRMYFGSRTPMPVSFKDILEALEFVSASGMGEHQAFLCKQSGRVYWHSEFSDELDEL